ncbi:hypothetical protein [Paraburkholderia caribensis]|uniref:hypothetical protein n=1 Tax=Paraburkholderia caribensis TaxID=75105 RepID=UPI0031DA7BE8
MDELRTIRKDAIRRPGDLLRGKGIVTAISTRLAIGLCFTRVSMLSAIRQAMTLTVRPDSVEERRHTQNLIDTVLSARRALPEAVRIQLIIAPFSDVLLAPF